MRFPLPNLQTLRRRFALPLKTVLNISWWAVLVIFLILLFVDGLVFYQYGLGRAVPPALPAPSSAISVDESSFRSAATILQERRRIFQETPGLPADFPNPFR